MESAERTAFQIQEDPFKQPLRCIARRFQTPDAVTFTFEAENSGLFHFHAGQFVILQLEIEGQPVQRAYSISSSPTRPFALECTVKRVAGGLVSNWLIDHFQVGDSLTMSAPAGAFSLQHSAQPKRYLLLSAGSGITPMIAMTRYLLDRHQTVEIHFVHSSPNPELTLFQAELSFWANKHANFHLYQLFSDVGASSQLLAADWLSQRFPALNDTEAYVCGPEAYMAVVESALQQQDFDMQRFFKESFTPATSVTSAPVQAEQVVDSFVMKVAGKMLANEKAVPIVGQQSILEAVEAAGLAMQAACRAGVCGACQCQVVSGESDSNSQVSLSAEQIAQGYVLACSTVAKSDLVIQLP